jgi:hypothetical protein
MKFIVVETTDGKYKGSHLEMEALPVRGELFTLRDFTYEVLKVDIVDDLVSVYGTNYIAVIKEILYGTDY